MPQLRRKRESSRVRASLKLRDEMYFLWVAIKNVFIHQGAHGRLVNVSRELVVAMRAFLGKHEEDPKATVYAIMLLCLYRGTGVSQ
jgi:hypothetical protein